MSKKVNLLHGLKATDKAPARKTPYTVSQHSWTVRLSNLHYVLAARERYTSGKSGREITEEALLLYLEKYGRDDEGRRMTRDAWVSLGKELVRAAYEASGEPLGEDFSSAGHRYDDEAYESSETSYDDDELEDDDFLRARRGEL